MNKTLTLLSLVLLLFASSAFASAVDRVFSKYQDGDVLVGYDRVIDNQECTVEFKDFSDGRTMTLFYQSPIPQFTVERMTPSGYVHDFKSKWFGDYIYSSKSHSYGLGDALGDFVGGYGVQDYAYTAKFYYDGDYNITRVLYSDDLNETVVSDCILD